MLDTYTNVDGTPLLMRILTEKAVQSDHVVVPSMFEVVRDVTDMKGYSNYAMARSGWHMPEEDKKRMLGDDNPQPVSAASPAPAPVSAPVPVPVPVPIPVPAPAVIKEESAKEHTLPTQA